MTRRPTCLRRPPDPGQAVIRIARHRARNLREDFREAPPPIKLVCVRGVRPPIGTSTFRVPLLSLR